MSTPPLEAKHTVFTSKVVENLKISVSAMCTFGDNLLVLGHEDGTISVFRVEADSKLMPATQYHRPRSKGKASVAQLIPILDLSLLLAIIDGTILQLDLTPQADKLGVKWTLDLRKEVPVIQRCCVMAAKKENDKYYLAAGCKQKHKLYIAEYRREEMGFSVRRDLNLPSAPLQLAWNRDEIYVGFKKDVGRLNISSEVANPGIAELVGYTCGASTPVSTEALLLHPKTGHCVAACLESDVEAGIVRPRQKFMFKHNPQVVEAVYPYVLGVSENGIEVQTLPPLADSGSSHVRNVLCQELVSVAQPKLLSLSNYVDMSAAQGQRGAIRVSDDSTPAAEGYQVATPQPAVYVKNNSGQVYALVPAPFKKQIEELTKKYTKECFESALVLCKLLTPRDVPDVLVEKVNLRYGFLLFGRKEYSSAMRRFNLAHVDPRLIIKMFDWLPKYVAEKWRPSAEDEACMESAKAAGMSQDQTEDERHSARTSFRGWLKHKRRQTPTSAVGDPLKQDETEDGMKAAAVDTAYLFALLALKESEDDLVAYLAKPNKCVFKDCERALRRDQKWRAIISLKRSKGLDRKALTFLQELGKGKVPPSEYETGPAAAGPALTDDEQHTLRRVAVEETISYLRGLDGKDRVHADLILEFSAWVLKAAPEVHGNVDILDMFWPVACGNDADGIGDASDLHSDNATPPSPIPPLTVLQHLKKYIPTDLKHHAAYLSRMIEDPQLQNHPECNVPKTHEALIRVYVEYIQQLRERKATAAEADAVHLKLRKFLQESEMYNAKRMVEYKPFQEPAFARESAIIRCKLGEHREALRLLVHELDSPDDALEYCNKHYKPREETPDNLAGSFYDSAAAEAEAGEAQRSQLHYILLQLYLEPPPGRPARVKGALALLQDHADKIDCLAAMQLLPSDTNISDTAAWITKVLRDVAVKARETKVYMNLCNAELQQVSVQRVIKQQERVEVHSRTLCGCCGMKIGNSQFAYYPNKTIVHSSCVSKYGGSTTLCPATKTTFSDLDDVCKEEPTDDLTGF